MRKRLTIELEEDEVLTLEMLAQALGFSPAAAALYAIRLTGACVQEGLIENVPPRAWPAQARRLFGAKGKVIAFPCAQEMRVPAEK